MDIQHQLISIALVALAALISVGFNNASTALLAYPLLAVFLSAVWSYNDLRIYQIGAYIHDRIETRFLENGSGWEHTMASSSISKLVESRTILATRGILICTEILTLILYLLLEWQSLVVNWNTPSQIWNINLLGKIALLILNLIAIFFTVFILRRQNIPRETLQRVFREPVPNTHRP